MRTFTCRSTFLYAWYIHQVVGILWSKCQVVKSFLGIDSWAPLKFTSMDWWTQYILAMSNQRSFKIESFRFVAFVPKKIEYIRYWNKNLDRNKTFSISSRKIWSKSFCSGLFPNFFWNKKKFCFVFRKPWHNCNVLVLFWYHFLKIQKFFFDSWAAWSKQKRSELVKKFGNSSQKFRFVSSEA